MSDRNPSVRASLAAKAARVPGVRRLARALRRGSRRHEELIASDVALRKEMKRLRIRVENSLGKQQATAEKPFVALDQRLLGMQETLSRLATGGAGGRRVRDAKFRELTRPVHREARTLLGDDRLWILYQAVRNVAPLGLPAAEVGSYRGGSAYFLASAFLATLGYEVPIDVIDTFEGHPEHKLSEHDAEIHGTGLFRDTSFEDVRDYLSPFELVHVHRGEFSAVAPTLVQDRYGLAHVDVDLYEPALDCLRFFGPRLPRGGVMILDDFDARKCPGIRIAAEEYLSENPRFQAWNPHTEQLVLIKIGGDAPAQPVEAGAAASQSEHSTDPGRLPA